LYNFIQHRFEGVPALQTGQIKLSDIEFVTSKTTDDDDFDVSKYAGLAKELTREMPRVGHTLKDIERVRKESQRKEELANMFIAREVANLFENLGSVREVDWSKVRDLEFNEIRREIRLASERISSCRCVECPDFLEHVYISVPFVG